MTEIPLLHHVHEYLVFHAERRGSQTAIVCGGERLTYADLLGRVRACASGLIAAGINPGDRVATLSGMRTEYLVVFLAASMVGAVWMGLNPRYRRHELLQILRDARPRVLFTQTDSLSDLGPEIIAVLDEIGDDLNRLVLLDDGHLGRHSGVAYSNFMDGAGQTTELARRGIRSGRDPVLLVYTSGTTGTPKGALLTHEGLIARAMNQNRVWPCDPIRVVNHLPINHIGGVGFISLYCLVGGGTQFLDERFDPEGFLNRLTEDRITIWITLPTIALRVLGHPFFSPYLPDLQWAVWSGAPLPVSAIRVLRSIGCGLGSSYGLTESSGSVCYAASSLDDETLSRTIGRPVPDGEVIVGDADGHAVPPGEAGEIQLRPEWAMAGYLDRDAANREVRAPSLFVRTGDLGRVDADGCIELVGRLKEMFKSGGYNVYPREIEVVIESHPEVVACAVVPVSDPMFQEVGIAFVQKLPSGSAALPDLRAWCASHLAHYKIPKQFRFLDTLPALSIGKLDRQAMRALAATSLSAPTTLF
jgi:acyl-CoA synthetase (AMP-forming)/AMP-acid ligase II